MKIVRLICMMGLLFPPLVSAGERLPVPSPHSLELISGPAGLYRDTPPVLDPPLHYLKRGYYRIWERPASLLGYRNITDEAADRLNYEHAIEQERLRNTYEPSTRRYESYYGYDMRSAYRNPPTNRDYWW
jgi:hypothetical protein